MAPAPSVGRASRLPRGPVSQVPRPRAMSSTLPKEESPAPLPRLPPKGRLPRGGRPPQASEPVEQEPRYANTTPRPSQLQPRKTVADPAKRMLPARSSELVVAKTRVREEVRESSPEQEEREEARELVSARSRELVVAKPSKARMREERREGLGGSSPDQLDSGFGLDSGTSRRSSFTSRESGSESSVCSEDLQVTGRPSKSEQHLDRAVPLPAQRETVGFGLLPNQVYRKAVQRGFEFSLMVVGESGLGKSTLVNSMFLADIYGNKEEEEEDREDRQTLQVETHHCDLEENGVKLALTVVDTPGYGDAVDNTDCWDPILAYIEDQFDIFLEAETRVTRVQVADSRVHACLYFIAPTGHGLKPLDVEFMRRIHNMVNIIPVIGKSDSCTKQEVSKFKAKILRQLEQHGIRTYSFPETEEEAEGQNVRGRLPFAVVGSSTILTDPVTGARYRGREYPWGTVNIEDEDHCDFTPLRNLVLAHHMQDLKDVTHSRHYENFRCVKLQQMMHNMAVTDDDESSDDLLSDLGRREREGGVEDPQSELESNFSLRISRRLEGRGRQEKAQGKLWGSQASLKPRSLESLLRGGRFQGGKLRGLLRAMAGSRGQD